MIGPHPFHAVGEKYIAALVQAADCLPLVIPVLETPLDVTEILARVDGIFFPGSPSNVEPVRYSGTASQPGTLHQRVHEVPGFDDHREDKEEPLDVQYGPAHEVTLEPGGLLLKLAGRNQVTVNSLHSQGVDRLGPDLAVEARAPDGLVEAFRVKSAPNFALAVQWHPEWQVMANPFSMALFAEFGKAARLRANS
jgi:putative glutamine amidotransferase